jgi:hypothetical protein
MLGLERYLAATEPDKKLRELVKIRASQINGAPSASTCTPKKLAAWASPSNAFTPLARG